MWRGGWRRAGARSGYPGGSGWRAPGRWAGSGYTSVSGPTGRLAGGCSGSCAAVERNRTGRVEGIRAVATSLAGWTSRSGRRSWSGRSGSATGRRTRSSAEATAGRWCRWWTVRRKQPLLQRVGRRTGGCGGGGDAGAAAAVHGAGPHDYGGQRQGVRGPREGGGGAPGRVLLRHAPALVGEGAERAHERSGAAVPAEGDGPSGDHRRAGESGAGPAQRASGEVAGLPDPGGGAARRPPSVTRFPPRQRMAAEGDGRGFPGASVRAPVGLRPRCARTDAPHTGGGPAPPGRRGYAPSRRDRSRPGPINPSHLFPCHFAPFRCRPIPASPGR